MSERLREQLRIGVRTLSVAVPIVLVWHLDLWHAYVVGITAALVFDAIDDRPRP